MEGSFTQVAYFTSETEARNNEQSMTDDASYQRFTERLEGPTSFYDLTSPGFPLIRPRSIETFVHHGSGRLRSAGDRPSTPCSSVTRLRPWRRRAIRPQMGQIAPRAGTANLVLPGVTG